MFKWIGLEATILWSQIMTDKPQKWCHNSSLGTKKLYSSNSINDLEPISGEIENLVPKITVWCYHYCRRLKFFFKLYEYKILLCKKCQDNF